MNGIVAKHFFSAKKYHVYYCCIIFNITRFRHLFFDFGNDSV